MESGQVQNVVWCDSAFHVERSWYGLVFSLREVLVDGKVIVDTPERLVPLEHVAIADGLLNQPLHTFDRRVWSAIFSAVEYTGFMATIGTCVAGFTRP
jgi:hypothetical protein